MGIFAMLREKVRSRKARLPRGVRSALGLGRIIGGLKGLWGLWGFIVALVTDGTLWAVLQSWPVESRVAWMVAATLAVFVGLGQVGALVKANSGQISFMSERAFSDYVAELLEDITGELARENLFADPSLR